MIELQLPEQAFSAFPRYTDGNGFMTLESRTSRVSKGGGVKSFEGLEAPDRVFRDDPKQHEDYLRYGARVWRTDETIEAAELLSRYKRIAVVGAPQSGKGTIVYGISCICDIEKTGYILIDGHWQNTPGEKVAAEINEADKQGKIIFYDSFDYNFAGTGKMRRMSKVAQIERTGVIVEALEQTRVPLVLTQHDEYHNHVFMDQNLLARHSNFLGTLFKYELPRTVSSAESRFMFFVDHNMTTEEARQLVELPDNPAIRQSLVNRTNNGDYIDEFSLALSDYGTMKELVRNEGARTKELLAKIRQNVTGSHDEFIDLALSIHFKLDFMTTLRKSK